MKAGYLLAQTRVRHEVARFFEVKVLIVIGFILVFKEEIDYLFKENLLRSHFLPQLLLLLPLLLLPLLQEHQIYWNSSN